MTSLEKEHLSSCVYGDRNYAAAGINRVTGNDRKVYQGDHSLLSSVASFPGSGPFSTRVTAGVPRGNDATASGASTYVDRSPKDPSYPVKTSIPNPDNDPPWSWYQIEQEHWEIIHMGQRPRGGNKCL